MSGGITTLAFENEVIGRLKAIEAMIEALSAGAEDEEVFKDPPSKYWEGGSYAKKWLSQCTPDYLRALAKWKNACTYMAEREGDPEKKKYAERDKLTARRALQWAVKVPQAEPF